MFVIYRGLLTCFYPKHQHNQVEPYYLVRTNIDQSQKFIYAQTRKGTMVWKTQKFPH